MTHCIAMNSRLVTVRIAANKLGPDLDAQEGLSASINGRRALQASGSIPYACRRRALYELPDLEIITRSVMSTMWSFFRPTLWVPHGFAPSACLLGVTT